MKLDMAKLKRNSLKRQQSWKVYKNWVRIVVVIIISAIGVTLIIKWMDKSGAPIPKSLVSQDAITINIGKDQAAVLMGELEIKLTSVKMDNKSEKYKIDAYISTPGNQPMELQEEMATGEAIYYYPKNRKFKIRIISANLDSATFRVEKTSN